MEEVSTLALWHRCARSDDERLWSALVRRLEPRLRGYVRGVLHDHKLTQLAGGVDDNLQEVYCRLLERSRRTLRATCARSDASLMSYLRKVCWSVILDQTRRTLAAKRQAAPPEVLAQRLPPPPDAFELSERRLLAADARRLLRLACIREASSRRIGVRNSWIVERALFHGWPSSEIATQVGISPSTVDGVVARCRASLARAGWRLPRRCQAPSAPRTSQAASA